MLPAWRLCLAVVIEAAWEIIENSDFVALIPGRFGSALKSFPQHWRRVG
jgi:hypothetical protein